MKKDIVYNEDCLEGLKKLPDNCVDCCVTSPPYYGLRDYGHSDQIGLELTPELFVSNMVLVFNEVKRVLKPTGTLWLNLGDTYSGSGGTGSREYSKTHKQFGSIIDKGTFQPPKYIKGYKSKDLIGIPWMVAFALRSAGWYLRQDIIWSKPNPMPESVTDRCTKAHEYIFLLSKSSRYYYDSAAIEEPCVWDVDYSLTQKRSDRQTWDNKNTPDNLRNGIRPRKKGPQVFGGNKAREGQLNGGDPRNGNRTDENSQWGKVWDNDKATRNKRSVWSIATQPYSEAHFATFPQNLIVDCIKAGCPEGGIVLDPFMGAFTTALVARKLGRHYIGFELNPHYIKIGNTRLKKELGMFI